VDKVLANELAKFRDLKGVEIVVDDDTKKFLSEVAFERSMNEGARGAPRAVNQYIVTPAIDILTDGEDSTGALATKLFATKVGVGDQRRVILNKE
jgi:ATP-dependent Clp protease ATP-binding subunit ClpA